MLHLKTHCRKGLSVKQPSSPPIINVYRTSTIFRAMLGLQTNKDERRRRKEKKIALLPLMFIHLLLYPSLQHEDTCLLSLLISSRLSQRVLLNQLLQLVLLFPSWARNIYGKDSID